jgi:sugar fermentation stimulation protein A
MRLIEGEPVAGRFLDRPNRFVINCEVDGRVVAAYLPNPGRLWELLKPGVKLLLAPNGPTLKLPYTVMALEKEGIPILLHTHKTNDVAEHLLRKGLVPGLENATIVRREATFGKSRFDFLLERVGQPFLLEVKNCTLFWGSLAMFPDALTDRGSRHLLDLARHARDGMEAGVLFVVNWPHARYFMPEHHTDLAFCQNLLKVRKAISIRALAVSWQEDLSLSDEVRELTIPWDVIERQAKDRGSYIVILRLDRDRLITVGELGEVFFRKGFYLYVGSAMKGLTARMERHRRLTKTLFWHIDYLRAQADIVKILPIRSPHRMECVVAQAVREVTQWSIKGFGCSDCRCESHLFGTEQDPLSHAPFIDALYGLRMSHLERQLVDAHR